MYIPYQPISKKPDASTYVPAELGASQRQGIHLLGRQLVNNWDDYTAQELGVDKEQLWNYFSSEQIDSIGLAIWNFKKNKAFIIADETGIGKGRILSGICRWAFKNNKRVLFFTEREHLFTDFWRDLTNTGTVELLRNPIVFHSTARVYDAKGEAILKGSAKQVKDIEKNGFSQDTNLVLTNYSQVSLKQHKDNKRHILEHYCEEQVIILDESHNATGDSNTKKFLTSLLKKTPYTVFSSATFIKDESQLDIYQNTLNFDSETLKLFKRLLQNDSEKILRKVFTYELTRQLQFWRREHEPLNIGWKSVVVPETQQQRLLINNYSSVINQLFELTTLMGKHQDFATLNIVSNWYAYGATINRLSKNLLLLLKIPQVIEAAKESLNNNHKAVIVMDSTFFSIIKKVVEHQSLISEQDKQRLAKKDTQDTIELDDEQEPGPSEVDADISHELNFARVLHYVVDEIAGHYIKEKNTTGEIKDLYEKILDLSESFSDIPISPIDTIIEGLAAHGVQCHEVSGRNYKIVNGEKIQKIKKVPKSQLVREFNDGEVNAILLTRAGASGLSLHAGADFKDQRVRDFYELEITNRPTYRLQFIGRVNRKNQVVQPQFFSVVTQLPFEQRILNAERQKIQRMQSHISGDDEKLAQENVYNFYTPYCDKVARSYLAHNPFLAAQMGISIKGEKEPLYFIDSLLKRCMVLSYEKQNEIYDYLIYAVDCSEKLSSCDNNPIKRTIGNIQTQWHELDTLQQQKFKSLYGELPQNSVNQFLFPWVGLMTLQSAYSTHIVYSDLLKRQLNQNIQDKHTLVSQHLKVIAQHLVSYGIYNSQFRQEQALPILNYLKLGTQVSIKGPQGSIFGYVHNVFIPPIDKPYKHLDMYLVQIKAVNPHLHASITYAPEDYYITLKDLLESAFITLHDKPVDWIKFDRPAKEFERTKHAWVGHPVYMEFLKQAYGIGKTYYVDMFGKKIMYVLLPDTFSLQELKSLKKPIYDSNKIMEGLIAKKISALTTTWKSEQEVQPSFKLESTTGGYLLYVVSSIWRDYNLLDFALRKKLKDKRASSQGYEIFFVAYKDIRSLLFTLEQQSVIWFVSKGSMPT